MTAPRFAAGALVRARGREWIVLPGSADPVYRLRPISGAEDELAVVHAGLEPDLASATFALPSAARAGNHAQAQLLRDALLLGLRRGAGPFPSLAGIAVEPRAYQLVPLLMALKQETVRLLIADDVGLGKTIEASIVLKELLERGTARRATVLCPPHLVDQWVEELQTRFHVPAVAVTSATAARLERNLPAGMSLFEAHPITVVSLDYIKADRRRDDFARACPELVLVDEAHTCTMGGVGRHQRYELLKRLLEGTDRHALLLTATPHSGDEHAFWHLLALLDTKFAELATADGARRETLRKQLADHFVQRRRADIDEWREGGLFPDHERTELTYRLDERRARFQRAVLDYCRTVTERAGDDERARRLSFWGTLALLRCVSSSAAAAASALATRLSKEAGTEPFEESLYDDDSELHGADDLEPAADDGASEVRTLLADARALAAETTSDPKLLALLKTIAALRAHEHNIVVFCQYIATAEAVGETLKAQLPGVRVEVVTGRLAPDERRERVDALAAADARVLVATDCLSEGINLQHGFDAVVHYDLSWNPVRHEQREGRVDRFGQRTRTVRSVLLYGEDNPVDGAVLEVILRKAEKIRRELGVAVPLPEDRHRMTEALLKTVLLRGGVAKQLDLSLDGETPDRALELAWTSQAERARATTTRYAQRRLTPDDVMPELERVRAVLGTADDVARFVMAATSRLGAAASPRDAGGLRIPIAQLPSDLAERARHLGLPNVLRADPSAPPAGGTEHLHRTHPFVGLLAETLMARALDDATEAGTDPSVLARVGVWPVAGLTARTVVLLCRLRHQLATRRGRRGTEHVALVEEAVLHGVQGTDAVAIPEAEARRLLALAPVGDLPDGARAAQLRQLEAQLPTLQASLSTLATERAARLEADHARVTEAARDVLQHVATPMLPVDVIGAWVLLPTVA